MANYKELLPHIYKWEGGYVNDPDDSGGATNMGVTLATYEAYCRKKGYPRPTEERLKALSKDAVEDILKTLYWDRWKADEIKNQSIANLLVDWVWGSGSPGIKIPQRILGVKQDGIVGPKTLAALDARNPYGLFEELKQARVNYYYNVVRHNPKNKKFLRGWLNRVSDQLFEY